MRLNQIIQNVPSDMGNVLLLSTPYVTLCSSKLPKQGQVTQSRRVAVTQWAEYLSQKCFLSCVNELHSQNE